MKPRVLIGRIGYRIAHRLLRMYWFLSHPEIDGVKCVLTDRDRVLLVRHTYGRREWDLPGGGMKRGESEVETARREMHEELGVWIDQWHSLGAIKASPYHSRDTLRCLHAELHDPELKIEPIELYAAEWFPRAGLPEDLGRHARRVVGLLNGDGQVTLATNARAAADKGASR
jgi:8-oxo-dGTP pyrophosphatase MutT (NUDIX family)